MTFQQQNVLLGDAAAGMRSRPNYIGMEEGRKMAAQSNYVFRTIQHPSAPTEHEKETGAFNCLWFHHLAEDHKSYF
jgi:hypothetical protein